MNTHDTGQIALEVRMDALPSLVLFAEGFAEQHEVPAKDSFALILALEELFANAVTHGGASAAEVRLQFVRGDVAVEYRDDGAEFDPTIAKGPALAVSAEERAVGGLGLHLIRTSMRDFCYERVNGQNVTRFRRELAAK